MKAKKGCLWGCGGFLGLLLLAWTALLVLQHTVAKWPDPVPGVRLEPSRPVLTEADLKPDNAFFYMRQWKSVKPAEFPRKENERWSACGLAGAPYPELDAWLAANAENLALCQKAAALPNCQVITPVSMDHAYPEIPQCRKLVTLLGYRAELAASKGDWNSAASDLRTALIVGSHISRGGAMSHRLSSSSLHGLTTASVRRIAFEQNPPTTFMLDMDTILAETVRTQEPVAESIRHERILVKNTLLTSDGINSVYQTYCWPIGIRYVGESDSWHDIKDRGGVVSAWLLMHGGGKVLGSSPQTTSQHLDVLYSKTIAATELPDYNSMHQTYGREIDGFLNKRGVAFLNDPAARMAALLCFCSVKILDPPSRERADLEGTRLVLAVRRWQLDHGGKPPTALADLVPAYIPSIPEDPFSRTHEPFRYRTDGAAWTVYSVGKNEKDDGGRYSQLDKEDRKQHPNELDLLFSSDEFQKKRDRYEEQQTKENGGTTKLHKMGAK